MASITKKPKKLYEERPTYNFTFKLLNFAAECKMTTQQHKCININLLITCTHKLISELLLKQIKLGLLLKPS